MLLSLDDFDVAAKAILPRGLYGFVAGGSETNASLDGNRASFANWRLRPRVLTGVTQRMQGVEMFGRVYGSPFGLAPMGGSGLSAFRADHIFAEAAKDAGIVNILSGASSIPLEKIHASNPETWFQAYLPHTREDKKGLAERLARTGYDVLVVTVDMTLAGNRENNLRNGFSMPVRINPQLAMQCLAAPQWLAGTFARTLIQDGGWHFENQTARRGGSMLRPPPPGTRRGHEALNWDDMKWLRDLWKGHMVLKGILAPEDAALARAAGMDGVIVSNHGGRQLDGTVSPLDALPGVVAAAGDMVVMMDGGIRRGTDVVKALALGARMVFVGRPFLFGAVVNGAAGVTRVAAILREEIDRDLALLGCADVASLSPAFLVRA